MSVLWAGLRLVAGALPWQAWAAVALALGVAAYGCSQRQAGERGAREEIRQSNEAARDKADGAERRVQDCTGVWDRYGGFCVPEDRAGR